MHLNLIQNLKGRILVECHVLSWVTLEIEFLQCAQQLLKFEFILAIDNLKNLMECGDAIALARGKNTLDLVG